MSRSEEISWCIPPNPDSRSISATERGVPVRDFTVPFVAAVLACFAGNAWYSPPNPLYYILPGYSDFTIYREVTSGALIDASDVAWLTLYAADFVLVMLLLALWRFRKKEIV